MKKKLLWVMAAILTISGPTTMLTSCVSNDDNAVPAPAEDQNPLVELVRGDWYTFYSTSGTTKAWSKADMKTETTIDYTMVMDCYYFGSQEPVSHGTLIRYYYEGDNQLPTAFNHIFFDYTSTEDKSAATEKYGIVKGQIALNFNENTSWPWRENAPTRATLDYDNGSITASGQDNQEISLTAADEQMTDYLDRLWGQGGAYNPSDDKELEASLADVKYEIIRDTAMWKFDILSNVYGAIMRDHDIEAELEKMRNEAQKPLYLKTNTTRAVGTTRSVADPKVVWSPSGFRYIDYTYESVDEQGKPITLSSRVCWGVTMLYGSYYDEFRPCDLVLCAHSTIADDLEAPTLGGSAETLMLQGDRVLILPDYIGYGVTKDRVHPYINHDLCARNCIDALKAGYKVFADKCSKTLHPDWKFYVIGASQGGGNALAIHKWLDTHEDFAKLWRFEYSYCAAGPYSPGITFKKYFEQEVLDYPIVMPLTLKAMFAAYPDILGKWKEEDFYSETYLQHKADIDLMISSKEFASGDINSVIFKMFPHTGETGIKPGEQIYMTDILNPEVCDMESEKCKALFQCFEKNDLTKGWTPIHPIHLYHGKSDTYVSYANSEAVMAAFPDKATLKEPTKEFSDHIKTCVLWMLSVAFGLW